jgi:hypothetical protein
MLKYTPHSSSKVYEPVEEGSYIKMIDMVSGHGGQIQVSSRTLLVRRILRQNVVNLLNLCFSFTCALCLSVKNCLMIIVKILDVVLVMDCLL